MSASGCPSVPLSWGELLDKITILEIKRERIDRADARANVVKEYDLLRTLAGEALEQQEIASLVSKLRVINERLWDIEDAIRDEEAKGRFGADFIGLARAVYKTNDRRAEIKRAINLRLASELIEEKSYRGMVAAPPGARIGVLTFHRCFNYGSYWQARCLVEGLRAEGHDAELLDHDSLRVRRAEERCLMQPALPERTVRSDLPLYKAKGRKFIDALTELPRSTPFSLDQPDDARTYDIVVVGSDEVWNFRHPWYGNHPLFFGSGLKAGRLVSYAASFGNHDASDGISPDWSARLQRFAAISVRDANSSRLVRTAIGAEPELVLDPCLQFADLVRTPPRSGERPYALVYGHGFANWLSGAARRWSDESGVRLLSVGYRNSWADDHEISAGPHDFAALVAGARAVITNFFHGCVFALLNGKPFVSAPSAYRFNKVRDLAQLLGAHDRLVDDDTPQRRFDALLDQPIEERVAGRIAELRYRSSDFFRAALA